MGVFLTCDLQAEEDSMEDDMFADLGEEKAEQKAPAVGISMYDNLPRKQQQTSSLKRPIQPDTEPIPAKKPKPSRTAVLPGFRVTLAAAEDKGMLLLQQQTSIGFSHTAAHALLPNK